MRAAKRTPWFEIQTPNSPNRDARNLWFGRLARVSGAEQLMTKQGNENEC